MGCYNATCGVSNLPIIYGEPVACFLLVKSRYQKRVGETFYATDSFSMLCPPIFGKYNDYGGIEEISDEKTEDFERLKQIERLLESMKFFYYDDDGFKEMEGFSCLEAFISDCHQERIFMKGQTIYNSEKGINSKEEYIPVTTMMVHYDLYSLMMDEMKNRKLYDSEKTYQEYVDSKVLKILDKMKATNPKCFFSDEKVRISKELFSEFKNAYPEDFYAETILEGKEDVRLLLKEIVDMHIWESALNSARKGFYRVSGLGSQEREFYFHKLIAQWVINHCSEYAQEMEEPNVSEDEILRETIMIFDS